MTKREADDRMPDQVRIAYVFDGYDDRLTIVTHPQGVAYRRDDGDLVTIEQVRGAVRWWFSDETPQRQDMAVAAWLGFLGHSKPERPPLSEARQKLRDAGADAWDHQPQVIRERDAGDETDV